MLVIFTHNVRFELNGDGTNGDFYIKLLNLSGPGFLFEFTLLTTVLPKRTTGVTLTNHVSEVTQVSASDILLLK